MAGRFQPSSWLYWYAFLALAVLLLAGCGRAAGRESLSVDMLIAGDTAGNSDAAAAAGASTGSGPGTATQEQPAQSKTAEDPCISNPDAGPGLRFSLVPVQRWNPPGTKRIGLQAGHWLNEETPPVLRRLQPGSSGGGKQEWEVNLDLAERAADMLRAVGIEVDVLPTTVPPRYRAHAFIAIHADGDTSGQLSGFKAARPSGSAIPETDDRLVRALYDGYESATGLRRDDEHISGRMRNYYTFNARRYCYAVAPGVPQAILETGFLTNASDRWLLLSAPDVAARGIADGILTFLSEDVRS